MKKHLIKTMKLKDLKPADYNPRSISDEALKGLQASLARFGVVQHIVFNQRSKQIVGGHQRVKALLAAGEKETQVVVVDLSEREEKALNITLNNPMIAGDFTADIGKLLEDLRESMPEFFVETRMDALYRDLGRMINSGADPEEDEAPDLPAKPKAVLGDLYRMGDHLLLCGDSTDIGSYERLLGNDKADMIFTDPPYGVSFGKQNYNPTAKKWKAVENDELTGEKLYDFCLGWIGNLLGFSKEAAPVYVWTASMAEGYTILRALMDGGLHMQSQVVWMKNVFALGQADYQWKHEICWYGWTPGKKHFWAGGRDQSTVWEESKDSNATYKHPTQKPVSLAARAIKNSTMPGGVVLDIFSGSGSTLMACYALGRTFRGIEIDPAYVDVAVERWSKATGKKAEIVDGK